MNLSEIVELRKLHIAELRKRQNKWSKRANASLVLALISMATGFFGPLPYISAGVLYLIALALGVVSVVAAEACYTNASEADMWEDINEQGEDEDL